MNHLVMFSGGVGSWAAARRVVEEFGSDDLHLIFADTLIEDEDLYRFLDEAAANLGGTFHRVADGRTPWEVFEDARFIGNSRVDPCSKILKRQLLRKWMTERFEPAQSVIYLGIDWTEAHRLDNAKRYWGDWAVRAPLCEAPYLDKYEILEALENEGIEVPRLYKMGFPHNNCGGMCVKAGEAQFLLLLRTMPGRFKFHEEKEQAVRELLGKDVAILRDRKTREPLTLRDFRLRVEGGDEIDPHDWGGCGCFSPDKPGTHPVSSLPLNIGQIEACHRADIWEVSDVVKIVRAGKLAEMVDGIGPKTEKAVVAYLNHRSLL
jgi:hypothetical protein